MKSGVFIIFVSLILVLSVSFVSAGIFCDVFGGNFCDNSGRELRGELLQASPGSCQDLLLNVPSDSSTMISNPGATVVILNTSEAAADWSGFGPIAGTKWIYHPTQNSARYSNYYYEKTFNVREGFEDYEAELKISADDSYEAFLNGHRIGTGSSHRITHTHDVTQYLEVGENKLRVRVYNRKHGSGLNFKIVVKADCIPVVIDEGPLVPECQWADRDLDGVVDITGFDVDEFARCHGSSYASNLGCFWADRDNSGDVSSGDNVPRGNCGGKRVPTTPYCEDSDNGDVYSIRGAINYKYEDINDIDFDTCVNDILLAEQSCEDNIRVTETVECDFGCSEGRCNPDPCLDVDCQEGYYCSEGECLEEEVVECVDSDGGKDYYEKGYAIESDVQDGFNIEDKCFTSGLIYEDAPAGCYLDSQGHGNGKCVAEAYCPTEGRDDPNYVFYECPNGCEDGACKVDPCAAIDCQPGYYCEEGSCLENKEDFDYIIREDLGVNKFIDAFMFKACDYVEVNENESCYVSERATYSAQKDLSIDGVAQVYHYQNDIISESYLEEIKGDPHTKYEMRVVRGNNVMLGYVEDISSKHKTILWISGNNQISVQSGPYEIGYSDDGQILQMLEPYFDKFPSTLDFNADICNQDENLEVLSDRNNAKIDSYFYDDARIAMYLSNRLVSIPEGNAFGIGFGIKNDGKKLKWQVAVADDNIRKKCGVSERVAESWITTGSGGEIGRSGKDPYYDIIRFNIPEGSVSNYQDCIIRYRLEVRNDDGTAHTTAPFNVKVYENICKNTPTYQVCLPLIEEMENPVDIIDNGNAYEFNYNYVYDNEWYIDGKQEKYKTYSSNYRSLNNGDFDGSMNIYHEVSVFDNIEVDAVKVIEGQTSGTVCIKDNYWGRDDTDNGVYICNFNALEDKQDIRDNHQRYTREIYWANNNVMVRVNINYGKYLSDEEVTKLGQESLVELLGKLKNNNFDYVSWDNFDIPHQARNFIERSLSQCNSEIKDDDDACNPSWQCKTEPLICPPHGEQTRTCYDAGCGSQDQVSISSCSPGICSGCYVSKWYDSKQNKCIPYGFRFEDEGEERVELVENIESERVEERDLNDGRDDYGLEILSDTEAQLIFAGEIYDLVEGENVRVRNEEYREDILYYDLEIIDVVQSNEGYVDMIIRYESEVSTREKIPSYCEIDGRVNVQKTKDRDGSWASCQNNYECESNICSNGECVDTKSAIQQAGALRAFFIRVVCRISTLAGDSYDQCLADSGI